MYRSYHSDSLIIPKRFPSYQTDRVQNHGLELFDQLHADEAGIPLCAGMRHMVCYSRQYELRSLYCIYYAVQCISYTHSEDQLRY